MPPASGIPITVTGNLRDTISHVRVFGYRVPESGMTASMLALGLTAIYLLRWKAVVKKAGLNNGSVRGHGRMNWLYVSRVDREIYFASSSQLCSSCAGGDSAPFHTREFRACSALSGITAA